MDELPARTVLVAAQASRGNRVEAPQPDSPDCLRWHQDHQCTKSQRLPPAGAAYGDNQLMDLHSFHTALRRFSTEFGVHFDFEQILERQYTKLLSDGSCVIDVGAHAGRHTAVFSRLCGSGQVVALEPLPAQAEMLRKLRLPNVTVHEVAAGDHAGRVSFVHAAGTPEESGLKARVFNFPEQAMARTIEVEMTRIDDVARTMTRCDYIKMDIEGAELTALKGGLETLKRFRPIVSVEYGYPGFSAYGHAVEDLYLYAANHGFVMTDLFGMPAATQADWLAMSGGWTWDFFMVPLEKLSSTCSLLQTP
ncbi:MAG: FkbM family methyltransferase [Beijerinckiaceae bacterium]